MIKLILPQILNPVFSILCMAYLQLRGQILNLLIPQIIFLAFGVAFSFSAIRKTTQNVQQIDHSPIFFILLLLLQFASLLYLSNENLPENLLCLLFGHMLQLQKLKSNEKNVRKQFLNIKIMLQALSLLIIFIVIVLFKNISNNFEYFIIAIILIIIVCLYEFVQSNYKNQASQSEQTKVIVPGRQSVLNQAQIPFQNAQGILDRFNDQQFFFISYRNNDIVVEKMSQFLIQILKEKCLSIEEYMKKIQLFQISYESEHILTNNMFEIKNANLYSFIRDQIIEEKQSAVMQRKSQSNMNDEQQQQKLISPQNEQRQRLQSLQRNDGNLQKCNTLNLNNSSLQCIDREFLSASVMRQFDILFVKPQDNNSQMANKKQQLYGIISHEKSIYKKMQISSWNQGLIIEIEDDSIENLKIQMNNIQNGYKQEVTQKETQKLSLMFNDLQQKFNKMLSSQNREDILLCQAQSQLYVLDIGIYNFIYFLSDGMPSPKQDQVNVISFLKSIRAKFIQDTTVIKKSIDISIQDDLNSKFITTDIRYLRQIIVNLLINSIKAYRKPDISNAIYIHVSQPINDEFKFEIKDKASGFSQPLDFKRVREGKLGIFIVQKLLPYISKNPQLSFKTQNFENNQVGSSISFVLPRQINPISNSLHNSQNNILQQESYKLAQIMQSQLITQQQDFI